MAHSDEQRDRSGSEAVLEALRADPAVGVSIIGADGVIRFINETDAKRSLDSTPERCVGRSVYELFPKEWADERLGLLARSSANSKPLVLRSILRGVQVQSTITPIGHGGDRRFLVVTVEGAHGVSEPDGAFEIVESAYADFGPLDVLSARELEVLALLKQGLTNRQIAQHLFRSPKTVENHIRSVSRKLGATTRVGLALIAQAAGLEVEDAALQRLP